MKKILLVLAVLVSYLTPVSASHMMGGQMTIQHVSGMTYVINYTAYRDVTGIPIATSATISYTDTVSGTSFAQTIAYAGPTVLLNGVETYVYSDTVTFPNAGTWDIMYEECCRNAAILNMSSPGVEALHFYTHFLVDSANSSPDFLNPPIVLGQLGVPFYYNPLPSDVDGDSIAWQLDIPLSTSGVQVVGYTLPPSDTLVPFNMDPLTGEITFLPNALGNYQVSVRVKEYRAGVQIGEISRDMQIIVVNSINTPSMVTLNSNTYPFSGKHYNVTPGNVYTANFTVVDPDNQGLTMTASGDAFRLLNNTPTFTTTGTVGSMTATLSWTPNASQARVKPYVFGIRTSENFGGLVFQSDFSLSLRVGNFTGISTINKNVAGVVISPNPVTADFTVSYQSENNVASAIRILSVNGQMVYEVKDLATAPGLNIVNMRNLNLKSGLYIVEVVQNGKSQSPVRMIVK